MPTSITRETRGAQMYPVLTGAEIERMRRFGTLAHFAPADVIVREGDTEPGIAVILDGAAEVAHQGTGQLTGFVHLHEGGSFMGELSQLSGRPWLASATAKTSVEALLISPESLRALMIAEADLGERLMRALILRRVGLIESGAGGPIIIGSSADARVLRLQTFLGRNGHPYVQLDPDEDSCARGLVERMHLDPAELPIVLCPNGDLLRAPDEGTLARCLGMVRPIDPERIYDVVVVGAGPAGLAASVYAASEGLAVLTLDCRAFGGQAGASARIENFLGFPTGISGMALMGRAYNQAQKFGVEIAIPDEAVRLDCGLESGDGVHRVALGDGSMVQGRTVVIASGARYRQLDLPGLDAVEATSVHYWASPVEARLCADEQVMLIGGGNSAGQAAVFLAGRAGRVVMLARRPLADTMSRYLIERIEAQPNIELVEGAHATGIAADGTSLQAVHWQRGEEARTTQVRHLFLFIGADPHTKWLDGCVALDRNGFVLTGDDVAPGRKPMETSRAGIFAIGDVRAGSVKRLAAAAGDGAQVVASIHQALSGQTSPA